MGGVVDLTLIPRARDPTIWPPTLSIGNPLVTVTRHRCLTWAVRSADSKTITDPDAIATGTGVTYV